VKRYKEGTPERLDAEKRLIDHDAKVRSLLLMASDTVNEWADKYDNQPNFWHAKNAKRWTREEAIEAFPSLRAKSKP
jgi:hypothetical protein